MTTTINGRTPEEIKRGAACCMKGFPACKECYLRWNDEDTDCCTILVSDLLALIQQLGRERDAAVEDLETMGEDMAYCDTCLHNNTNSKEEPCSSCMSGYLINNWQWRGVQEGEQ